MYINFIMEENKIKYVSYWLLSIILLVGFMIFIGGLTRLTDSGLSITEWNLISGIIPPLSQTKWDYVFSLYKEIPEFKFINSSMTLDEFKVIFWWEYIHRLLGRLIGLSYVIPLIYFTFKKFFKKDLIFYYYFIFFLICFQGFIGWFMVQSGLSERTDVSHFRLSAHLTLAFIILVLLVWIYLNLKQSKVLIKTSKLPNWIPITFSFLILLQISVGALVSGLDAGTIYQTWPLMGDSYFPNDANIINIFSFDLFNQASLVQFLHRNLAYLILFFFIIIFLKTFKNNNYFNLKNPIVLIFLALSFQILLGILTILSGAHITLASMHQIGSIFLIVTSINLIVSNSKN
jgi:heme a synthase